jgi:hypothetical protein
MIPNIPSLEESLADIHEPQRDPIKIFSISLFEMLQQGGHLQHIPVKANYAYINSLKVKELISALRLNYAYI